jgi:hypothetical protein
MARTLPADSAPTLQNPNHGGRLVSANFYAANGTTINRDLVERVCSFEIDEDVDGPRTCRISLFRQMGERNLSPLVVPEDYSAGGTSYLQPGRRVTLTVSIEADSDKAGFFADNLLLFDGFIDELSWADAAFVEVSLVDKTARMRDTWIEESRVYGFAQGVNAVKGCLVWRNDLPSVVLNDLVIPSDAKRNGHFYKATTVSGAQGTTEPNWPTGSGATVVSGSVTFTEVGLTSPTTGTAVETIIGQLLSDHGLSTLTTVQCPVSPAWNVKPYLQDRMSVLDAVKALADQLGWVCRFDWDSGTSAFQLFLKDPPRFAGSAVRSYSIDFLTKIDSAAVEISGIRNAIRITYNDSASRTAEGRATRKAITRTDAASIAKYGRRFMEIQEADASNIDTAAEANRMADAAVYDLREPTAQVSAVSPFDPYLELGDRVTLPADGVHWGAAQTLAIQGLRWTGSAKEWSTTMKLRGQPVAGNESWQKKDGRALPQDLHRLTLFQNLEAPTITPSFTVGGTKATFSQLLAKGSNTPALEVHVGAPGFTPSSSTIQFAGQTNADTIANLVAGKTYGMKVRPFAKNGDRMVLGEFSDEASFVAGRASAGHYLSTVSQAHFPLNGNFEHATDDLTLFPPDHWKTGSPTQGGTWGAAADSYWSTHADYGRTLLLRQTAVNHAVTSSPFPIRRGMRYAAVTAAYRTVSGMTTGVGRRLVLTFRFYRLADLSDVPTLWTVNAESTAAAAGTWTQLSVSGPALGSIPNGFNFATLTLSRSVADVNLAFEVGDVFFMEGSQAEELWPDLREVWLTVGGTGAGFNANWQNFGGGWETVAYMKDPLGFVRLRGLAQTTVVRAAGSTPFTLPVGYRPALGKIFPVITGGAGAAIRADVLNNGVVQFPANGFAANEWVSLDGIAFDTR